MHKLLIDQPGQTLLLLGNEAIARGAIEAGVSIATTYPGTPSSEISNNLFQVAHESELYFEFGTNEKVALEVISATANCGARSMCIMKHVGLNVAADPLMTLAYVGVKAGTVIVTADDPSMFSSQNEQDNRYYGRLAGLAILEPSSVQEAKEMTAFAFTLSEQLKEPVILRTTTRINHSTGIVTLGSIAPPVKGGNFKRDPLNYVPVPTVSRKLHKRLLDNLELAETVSETSVYNFVHGDGKLGIICSGISYVYVKDAVADLGQMQKIRILRVGISHPLPQKQIIAFLKACTKVLVVEEGEPILERDTKVIAQENGLQLPICGKSQDLFSKLYEFNPALVRKTIAAFFEFSDTSAAPSDLSNLPDIPQRPPTLCAGCPHRATFYAVKKAAKGMDTIFPTDIGCYTLGFLPPLHMGDFLICMGASVSGACGFSKVTDQKVISFIGDSTFFHSGITGLVNAVFNRHNFTLVILENDTTAMTGQQPHPGVDMDKLNLTGYGRISIEAIVNAIGVGHVTTIEPFKIKKSIAAIKTALSYEGVSVIISRQPCTLYAKALGKGKRRPFYVSDKCKNHRNCIDDLACFAFYLQDNRIRIDPALCAGCSVCAQICPENAILPVKS